MKNASEEEQNAIAKRFQQAGRPIQPRINPGRIGGNKFFGPPQQMFNPMIPPPPVFIPQQMPVNRMPQMPQQMPQQMTQQQMVRPMPPPQFNPGFQQQQQNRGFQPFQPGFQQPGFQQPGFQQRPPPGFPNQGFQQPGFQQRPPPGFPNQGFIRR